MIQAGGHTGITDSRKLINKLKLIIMLNKYLISI